MLIIIHVDKRCEVIMKHKKFIDELKGLGVVLVDGTNHYKAYYNGKHRQMQKQVKVKRRVM